MATSIQIEIENVKSKLAELQSFAKIQGELLALPSKYGFKDLDSFIKGLKRAVETSAKVKGAKMPKAPKAAKAKKGRKGGKRTRITQEIKDKVKAAVDAGKTGSEICKEFGISLPSVQNIKKEFGLVKPRAAAAAPAAPAAAAA